MDGWMDGWMDEPMMMDGWMSQASLLVGRKLDHLGSPLSPFDGLGYCS
jgi:hypothetical protein